ncbi:hypothetical protein [Orrella dioscoreae]|uniref:Uncharacterized protein n=1 Tax=Orrella dioscoreae TaxID=1851544 RepID=A0A1C3K7P9_9BURK|nr:hypothetical protein [Orrella dioscoreae]SBT27561.1 hypothetical protein ODI_02463 [Orrella dioscoreae]SOE48070.1 hypothetical protein ODI_R1218 [Orrella dioscoreae]
MDDHAETIALLQLAEEVAAIVLPNPSRAAVMAVFRRLCAENDALTPEEANAFLDREPSATMH